jgi:hypothetical protein
LLAGKLTDASRAVRKRTVESERVALRAKQRTLREEQVMLRRTPSWDVKARHAFVARLAEYEKRFRAMLRKLESSR